MGIYPLHGRAVPPPTFKRALSPTPPSPKRVRRVNPNNISTAGLSSLSIRTLLLHAINVYPATARHYIEARRPTLLDGLDGPASAAALVDVARMHLDIAEWILVMREKESEKVERFDREVAEAIEVMHSLDDERSSRQYSRSNEVSSWPLGDEQAS